MLPGPAIAGCIYICENGFTCTVACDGGGMFTAPDPATQMYQNNQSRYSMHDIPDDAYESNPKGRVKKIYPNEYVNDLPNTEEPDIFTIDIKPKPRGLRINQITICGESEYSGDYHCKDL